MFCRGHSLVSKNRISFSFDLKSKDRDSRSKIYAQRKMRRWKTSRRHYLTVSLNRIERELERVFFFFREKKKVVTCLITNGFNHFNSRSPIEKSILFIMLSHFNILWCLNPSTENGICSSVYHLCTYPNKSNNYE